MDLDNAVLHQVFPLLVMACVVWNLLVFWFFRPPLRTPAQSPEDVDPILLAYLTGGQMRAIAAAITSLVAKGNLRCADNSVNPVRPLDAPAIWNGNGSDPRYRGTSCATGHYNALERAVYNWIAGYGPTRVSYSELSSLVAALDPVWSDLHQEVRKEGLSMNPRGSTVSFLVGIAPCVLTAALGLGLWVAFPNAGFVEVIQFALAMLFSIAVAAGAVRLWNHFAPFRSRRGLRILKLARKRSAQYLREVKDPEAVAPNVITRAVAVGGARRALKGTQLGYILGQTDDGIPFAFDRLRASHKLLGRHPRNRVADKLASELGQPSTAIIELLTGVDFSSDGTGTPYS